MAYSVHLYHVIWLYILSLPFQLAESMGWWTIAGVSITAFTFLGILEIGSQIEDPFGYDDNDLVNTSYLLTHINLSSSLATDTDTDANICRVGKSDTDTDAKVLRCRRYF
jgi:predicted membrane chloride channel (bestrophin family)